MKARMISMSSFLSNSESIYGPRATERHFCLLDYLRNMQSANLILSPEEYGLLCNREVILTKNALLQKLGHWLGSLSQRYQSLSAENIGSLHAAFSTLPKVSRGEVYQGFPWLMLDYPRHFTTTDVCAIRSFCWWGHYGSVTLHLAGESLQIYEHRVKDWIEQELMPDVEVRDQWHLSVGTDPWVHALDTPAYRVLGDCKKGYWQTERSYLKLAKKIPLEQWDHWEYHFETAFIQLSRLLRT